MAKKTMRRERYYNEQIVFSFYKIEIIFKFINIVPSTQACPLRLFYKLSKLSLHLKSRKMAFVLTMAFVSR